MKSSELKNLAGLLCALLSTAAFSARADEPTPAFMQNLFVPELVMTKAREVGLSEDQRKAITKAIQETQAKTVDLQWSLQDAAAELIAEMRKERIDEKTALSAAEKMMEIEGRVKRAHLGLLIRIKNQLSPEQQEHLKRLRAAGS